MLRVIQNTSAAGAKGYYSTADYYTEGQELAGEWRGEGARRLGLFGQVDRAAWEALCDNRQPGSGLPLTLRDKGYRTVGYDLNFHVPKSVSTLYGLTGDRRVLAAFRASVAETMRDIEAEMQARVRKGGRQEDRTTGNMAWGEFVHFTGRPVDGVPDPHLHAHCFVFNATWDVKEQAWKAGQFRNIKRDAPYYQAVFHSRLAGRLAGEGFGIERTATGWEIAGIPQDVIARFSRRTELIEKTAEEEGITDPAEKDGLGARTRERKAKNLTASELLDEWRSRLTEDEWTALSGVRDKARPISRISGERAAEEAMHYAIDHCFVRKSVVPERELLAEALGASIGRASVDEVARQLSPCGVITGTLNGRRMATTPSVLDEERRMIDFARAGRGTRRALGDESREFSREWLNNDQKNAVRHVLSSRDRVIMVRGAAGVGKTALMQEAAEGIREGGREVYAFAPSAGASRGVLRDEGFAAAETVARLLVDGDLQSRIRGQVIWIDEAGLLGSKSMAEVFDLASRLDARVVLSGDRRQHAPVERGSPLRLLEEEAGIIPAEVREIKRQKGTYKDAVRALSEGNAGEGFDRLDRLGWVREVPEMERYRQLADDYVAAVRARETALVVSPTHLEKDRITREIRERLKDEGRLHADERPFLALGNANLTEPQRADAVHYQPGDVIQFHQNAKGGFRRGQRLEVRDPRSLPLHLSRRFQLYRAGSIRLAPGDMVRITSNGRTADRKHALNNGDLHRVRGFGPEGDIVLANGWRVAKDFGHLDYGYVVTSHAAQSKTVDRVFIGQSAESFPASSREQFYVSVSRGRKSATVYTDDKRALREAISHSDVRHAAVDLFAGAAADGGTMHRRHKRDQEHARTARAERDRDLREELVHER